MPQDCNHTIYAWTDPDILLEIDPPGFLANHGTIMVTVEQGDVLIEKTGDDLEVDVDAGTIFTTLTQEETGRLNDAAPVQVMANIINEAGKRIRTTRGLLDVEENDYEEVLE